VGLRVFLRWRWRSGTRTIAAVRAVDTATDPAWQRRGLFRRMTESMVAAARAEGVEFVFNTPNAKSRAGYLKMGWRDVGRTPVLLRVPRLALGGGRSRTSGAVLEPLSALLAQDGLEGFLEAVGADEERLHTPRTVAYLRWRYADGPLDGYLASWLLDGNRGAVVISREKERRGLAELSVAEVVASDDAVGVEAAASLLGGVLAGTRHHYAVACAARDTPERAALRRGGFLPPARIGPRMTVRPLAERAAAPDPLAEHNWRLAIGDLEVF
jgi:hypothetical protein